MTIAAVVGDPHAEKRRSEVIQEEVNELERYGRKFGCDEIWIAGDIGTLEYVELIVNSDFEKKRIVPGNHDNDKIDRSTIEKNGFLKEDVEFDCSLNWKELVDGQELDFSISHRPHYFDTRINHSKIMNHWHRMKDVIIHGHSHMSKYRTTDENILAIGCGSTYENFYEPLNPERSFQILEVNSDIRVSEIDLEEDGKVLEKVFEVTEDGIKPKESWGKDYQEKVGGKYRRELYIEEDWEMRPGSFSIDSHRKELERPYDRGIDRPNF